MSIVVVVVVAVAVAAVELTIVSVVVVCGIKPQQCQHKPIAWHLPLSDYCSAFVQGVGEGGGRAPNGELRVNTTAHKSNDKSIAVYNSQSPYQC